MPKLQYHHKKAKIYLENSNYLTYFALAFKKAHEWFLGRVARHRSAKPSTAVRIRQEPHKKSSETVDLQ